MKSCSSKALSASTVESYRGNISRLVLWLFSNRNSQCLTQETKESLQLAQLSDKSQEYVANGTPYSVALYQCCTTLLDKCIENSKSPIYFEGPERITLELLKEFVDAKQQGPTSQFEQYRKLRQAFKWFHGLLGLDWNNSYLLRGISDLMISQKVAAPSMEETEKTLVKRKRKWAPVSRPLDEAARKHKIYNQIDRSDTEACVAASHGPKHAAYTDHFTQTSFHLRGNIPPKPSFLDFIAKCGTMKLGSSQRRNPEMSSIYQQIEQTMDETALVALGIMVEECTVASMLPLARAYVNLCREKDIALQNSQKYHSATNDPQNDEESYNLKSFAHWTKPCEEAIVEMSSRSDEKFSEVPFLPSTQPANLAAKDPSTLSFAIPSISNILGRPFAIEERFLEETAKKEWFAKQSTNNLIDKDLYCLFTKSRRSEEFFSQLMQVASALEAMERNDCQLSVDLNLPIPRIIHSSESVTNENDIEM